MLLLNTRTPVNLTLPAIEPPAHIVSTLVPPKKQPCFRYAWNETTYNIIPE